MCVGFWLIYDSHERPHCPISWPRYHILVIKMATVYMTVSVIDPVTDKWSEYVERLQFYFIANGIKGDSKKTCSIFKQLWTINIPY